MVAEGEGARCLPSPSPFSPRRQDGESCFHNLDVLSLTSRHFLLSNLSLIFPIRSFLSQEEQPLQKRAVCLGCAPTELILRRPHAMPAPRHAGPARLGPGWLTTVGASSTSCLAEGMAGDRGGSVPQGSPPVSPPGGPRGPQGLGH